MDKPFIALSTPNLSGNERAYVLDCVDSAWISSVGKYVERFEKDFASYVGAPGAVAASSGTAALHLALIASGVKAGDAVFVPSLTFIAPVNAVVYMNATPVFVDSDESSLGISPESLRAFIKESCSFDGGTLRLKGTGQRVSAMVPVHLMGWACQMDELLEIAAEFKLLVVEDAAEGIGCLYKGRHVGTFGKAGCFSFNGNKTLTTGGGGMAVSAEGPLLKRMKHLSTQAKSDESLFEHDETGYNYRMTNVLAALGVAQLEHLDEMLEAKRKVHSIYEERFAGLEKLKLLTPPESCRSAFWMAILKTPSKESRELCVKRYAENGIQARPFWALNSSHPMYQSCPKAPLPRASELQANCVCMPCSSKMDAEQIERAVSATLAIDRTL